MPRIILLGGFRLSICHPRIYSLKKHGTIIWTDITYRYKKWYLTLRQERHSELSDCFHTHAVLVTRIEPEVHSAVGPQFSGCSDS